MPGGYAYATEQRGAHSLADRAHLEAGGFHPLNAGLHFSPPVEHEDGFYAQPEQQ